MAVLKGFQPLRVVVGRLLRLPLVIVVAIVWYACLWTVLAYVGILSVFAVIVMPFLYLVVKPLYWLGAAFVGYKGEILPYYWDGYPSKQFAFLRRNFWLGRSALRSFFLDGFE
jgi:hypothetical protein